MLLPCHPDPRCLAGTTLAVAAERRGSPVTAEIFADRAITADGLLVPATSRAR